MNDHFAIGHPRFGDARLAALARSNGALAAWYTALGAGEGDPSAVAQGVKGDFEVVLRLPNRCAFLAVDRFAVRSLCWRIDGGRLRFGSRADELADDSPTIDAQAIFDYLFFNCIPSPRTVFAGVQRLPPGHCGWWNGKQMQVRRYDKLHFEEPRGAVSCRDAADVAAELKSLAA